MITDSGYKEMPKATVDVEAIVTAIPNGDFNGAVTLYKSVDHKPIFSRQTSMTNTLSEMIYTESGVPTPHAIESGELAIDITLACINAHSVVENMMLFSIPRGFVFARVTDDAEQLTSRSPKFVKISHDRVTVVFNETTYRVFESVNRNNVLALINHIFEGA